MMRRFYAPKDAFEGSCVTLDAGETRHLRDVLRLHEGDLVSVFDGNGREFECALESIAKHSSAARIVRESSPPAQESRLMLSLAAAITKGEKFDLVVQKSVELGVTCLFPIVSKRCDIKIRDVGKRPERWRKIALEASKQCGRARLMSIENITSFSDFFQSAEAAGDVVFFSERGGGSFSRIAESSRICAVVGPEGGWEDSEIEIARRHNAQVITLGGRILRAETAAIAITSILQHEFGDLK